METETQKPRLKIIGRDGNAFAIGPATVEEIKLIVLGAAHQAARKAKWTPEQIKAFDDKAMSGDYNILLATCCDFFDVC